MASGQSSWEAPSPPSLDFDRSVAVLSAFFAKHEAGLDEGILPFPSPIVVYMENRYKGNK